MALLIFLLLFLLGALIAAVFSVNALINTLRFGLPYVSTPRWAIDWLAYNLQLTTSDTVYELGCGDARVLAALARKFPNAKFVGLEVQWWPYLLARWRTRNLRQVTIALGDFLQHDLSSATLVYGFFITVMMPKVAAKLRGGIRSGTKVISFGFAVPGWTPVEEVVNPNTGRGSKIRIYLAPLTPFGCGANSVALTRRDRLTGMLLSQLW